MDKRNELKLTASRKGLKPLHLFIGIVIHVLKDVAIAWGWPRSLHVILRPAFQGRRIQKQAMFWILHFAEFTPQSGAPFRMTRASFWTTPGYEKSNKNRQGL